MISLSPINKNVRETLVRREDAVSRQTVGTDHDSISDNLKDKLIKSVWVRMVSAVEWKGIKGARIFGGEVYANGEDAKIPFGYTELYDTPHPLAPQSDRLKRPVAGILDFTCEYKGSIKSIREATINWVAHSMDDLERLIPFFAAHGKGILLEWGYGTSSEVDVQVSSEKDIIEGKVYTKINQTVLESGGTYDGMCGIISNFEWTLRDDGSFDVQTTMVSRGVNVLAKQLDQADAPLASDADGSGTQEVWPTLGEFMAGINETLITIAVGSTSWLGSDGNSKPLSSATDTTWSKGSKQPPCVFMTRTDGGFLAFEKNLGPFMTWGWMEDNILSKWVGKYDEKNNITNSFRSIEPLINSETGLFIGENGDTNDVSQAKFQSVTCSNHGLLVTPHLSRWILPGQFPFPIEPDATGIFGFFDKLRLNDREFTDQVGRVVNDNGTFRKFAVSDNLNDGGYIRNILISTKLALECFQDAKTLQQGLQKLFDELNSDTNGFWNFQVVNDPYIAGNVKVIDTKSTLMDPVDYLEQIKDTEMSKVDKGMFVFESWGDRSIVKSQTLSAKLPSSFAVSAMYAGTAKPGTENTQGDKDSAVAGKQSSGDGKDQSQMNIVEPKKLSGKFGSVNSYLLEGAGDMSGESTKNKFGVDKGIEFDLIDWTELIEKYQDSAEARVADEKEEREKKVDERKKTSAKQVESVENFIKAFDNKELYDDSGDLKEKANDQILHKRVMNNIIGGVIDENKQNIDEKKRKIISESQGSTDLYPIELELSLDGIGGIYPGNVFHASYLPDRYKNFCVFQIMSVDQSVSSGVWETKISGQIRFAAGAVLKAANFSPNLLTQSDAQAADNISGGGDGVTSSQIVQEEY